MVADLGGYNLIQKGVHLAAGDNFINPTRITADPVSIRIRKRIVFFLGTDGNITDGNQQQQQMLRLTDNNY